jgi:hypothetical protein
MAAPAVAESGKVDRLLVLAAFACAVLAFLPMLGHSFYRDDFRWVARTIAAAPHPERWFTLAGSDFRPLASLSFVLNLKASGTAPAGYYAFNLALHLAVTALLMAFTYRLSGGSTRAAGVAGILFGVAFANYGESVYWICARTGPIADIFVLATLIAHWDGRTRDHVRERSIALACFGLALFAKETAAVLLPLLALVEWVHPSRRGPLGERLKSSALRLAPYAAMLIAWLAFQFLVWRAGSPILEREWVAGPHVATNLLEYAVRMFLPLNASSMMVTAPKVVVPLVRAADVALLVLLPVFWLVLLVAPVPRAVKFAAWWIPITILPVTFFTYRTSVRYLYTPSMGVAMLAGLGIAAWTGPRRGRVPRGKTGLALAALALVVVVQVAVMGFILARHRALERAEGVEEWARLQAVARAAGLDPGPARP